MIRLHTEDTADTVAAVEQAGKGGLDCTVYTAAGYWRGALESSLIVETTDGNEAAARALAAALLATGQTAILLVRLENRSELIVA